MTIRDIINALRRIERRTGPDEKAVIIIQHKDGREKHYTFERPLEGGIEGRRLHFWGQEENENGEQSS